MISENKINEDLVKALKGGDKVGVSVLRMLISKIKNKKIEEKVKELSDEKVLTVIKKMAKQYNESIIQFKNGNRDDLVEKEQNELKVILNYLPKEMDEEEVRKIVSEVIAEIGASSVKDMGSVIKGVMAKTAGGADGKLVSNIAKEKLG